MVRLPQRAGVIIETAGRPRLTSANAGVGFLGLLAVLCFVLTPARSADQVDGRSIPPAITTTPMARTAQESDLVSGPKDNRLQVHTHHAEPLGEEAYKNAPADVVLWGDLARALVVRKGSTFQTTFLPPVLALNGKVISIIGYVTPIFGKNKSGKQFLLSSHSFLCDECEPPAPTELVEVNTKDSVIAKDGIATIRGQFEILKNDPQGLAYRLNKAIILREQAR
ncbi:MAG: hypothetical protein ABI224_02530 [Acetobacteraceae bacterium]